MVKNPKYCNLEIWGGVECTINRIGDTFTDQLELINFYTQPRLEEITRLGIEKLRFPILWERHQTSLGTEIDWSWTEQQLSFFRYNGLDIIAGLVHHGSGPFFTNLLDEKFPFLLADYARKVARKFPWIDYYNPVNEPLTTARFSGLYGIWYPHCTDDKSFFLMLLHQLKGIVLSMQEIRKVNPDARLIQTEDLGKTYSTPLLKYQAEFENHRRWLTYDFLCGKVNEQHPLWDFFRWLKIPESLLTFFQEHLCVPDILGFNHYITSERFLDEKIHLYPPYTYGDNGKHTYADVEAARVEVDQETGLKILLEEAWERFQRPLALTEVHLHCHREDQIRWFHYAWSICDQLSKQGLDIKAITAWSIFGSFGWDRLLTSSRLNYEPGIYDMRGGSPRPTALCTHIRNFKSEHPSILPLAREQGWWQRPIRFLHEPMLPQKQIAVTDVKTKPILIIGKKGTLGKAFGKICHHRGINIQLLSREDCDIGELQSVEDAIDFYQPWAVINTAGYVRVDEAEKAKEQCFRENFSGTVNLFKSCEKHGIKLVTFSSDQVFDGIKNEPYLESDATNPLNWYGQSKALGEEYLRGSSALIIRSGAFFSTWDRSNFLYWVEDQISKDQPVYVANDVFISPTYIPDLVHAVLDLLIDDEKGVWHLANHGSITWADLALEVIHKSGYTTSLIEAVPLAEQGLPACRPKYSVLSSERAVLLPCLENALQRYFDQKKHCIEA